MIVEPHTYDPEPEQEPDCAVACADALIAIVEYLGQLDRRPNSQRVRVAALQVVVGRMTVEVAAHQYKVHRTTIYRHVKQLGDELGLQYIRGELRATTPPSKESLSG